MPEVQQCTRPSSALLSTLVSGAEYLVDLLQHQRTDPLTIIFGIYLAELVPVRGHGAHFLHSILIISPVEEVVDPTRRGLHKRVVWVNINHLAVPGKHRR